MFNKQAMSRLAPTTPNIGKKLAAENVIGKKKKKPIDSNTKLSSASPFAKAFGK